MKKQFLKKKMKYVAPVLAAVLIISGTALADGSNRRSLITSHGAVEFTSEEGSILIDSEDLYTLADEIDDLETTYKSKTTEALNTINTYIRSDGTITHNKEDADNQMEQPSFGLLANAIINSQSSSTAISDLSGTKYFKTNKGKISTSGTGSPITLNAATPDNLSAGQIAFVNGSMLLGTGADNEAYYNIGYANGYAQKMDGLDIQIKYHEHTDACYGERDDLQCIVSITFGGTYKDYCSGCWSPRDHDYPGALQQKFTYHHSSCGQGDISSVYCAEHSGPPNSYTHTYSGRVLICGKTEETVESATIIYP